MEGLRRHEEQVLEKLGYGEQEKQLIHGAIVEIASLRRELWNRIHGLSDHKEYKHSLLISQRRLKVYHEYLFFVTRREHSDRVEALIERKEGEILMDEFAVHLTTTYSFVHIKKRLRECTELALESMWEAIAHQREKGATRLDWEVMEKDLLSALERSYVWLEKLASEGFLLPEFIPDEIYEGTRELWSLPECVMDFFDVFLEIGQGFEYMTHEYDNVEHRSALRYIDAIINYLYIVSEKSSLWLLEEYDCEEGED